MFAVNSKLKIKAALRIYFPKADRVCFCENVNLLGHELCTMTIITLLLGVLNLSLLSVYKFGLIYRKSYLKFQ